MAWLGVANVAGCKHWFLILEQWLGQSDFSPFHCILSHYSVVLSKKHLQVPLAPVVFERHRDRERAVIHQTAGGVDLGQRQQSRNAGLPCVFGPAAFQVWYKQKPELGAEELGLEAGTQVWKVGVPGSETCSGGGFEDGNSKNWQDFGGLGLEFSQVFQSQSTGEASHEASLNSRGGGWDWVVLFDGGCGRYSILRRGGVVVAVF